MVKKTRLAVTTTGSAGLAVGTGVTEDVIEGRIVRVDVNYHASAPATTDLTLVQTNENQAANIVSLMGNNEGKRIHPAVQLTNDTGEGLVAGTGPPEDRPVVGPCFVADTLTVIVGGCDALIDAVVLEIYYEEN
jgi:hypothetical protein